MLNEVEYEKPDFETSEFYTSDIKYNVFFNVENVGRFGNYIYGAIETVILLFAFEYILGGKSPNDVVNNIKNKRSISKLYSTWNCRLVPETDTEDKYYYLTKKTGAFRYFNCCPNVFAEQKNSRFIRANLNDHDIKIRFDKYVSNYQICIKNGIIYFVVSNFIISSYGADDRDYHQMFSEIFNSFITKIVEHYERNIENVIVTYENENIKKSIENNTYKIPELFKKYINKEGIEHNEHKKLLTNELKKCFDNTTLNKIIIVLGQSFKYGQFLYSEQLIERSNSVPNFEREKNYVELTKSIKNILFDVPQYVNDLYNNFIEKYNNKKIIGIHFRGGDFESPQYDYGFRVLKPQDYIDRIQKLLDEISCKTEDALAVCFFHPNDEIFYSYIGIIKNKFKNMMVLTENDILNSYDYDSDNSIEKEKYKMKFSSIFSDETKHVYFMSLFKYFICSNSTYTKIAAEMNVNLDKNIKYNFDCYINKNMDSQFCSISHRCETYTIHWGVLNYIHFYIYKQYILNDNITVKSISLKDIYDDIKTNGRKIMKQNNGISFANNVINFDSKKLEIPNLTPLPKYECYNVSKIINNDKIYTIEFKEEFTDKFISSPPFIDFDYLNDSNLTKLEKIILNLEIKVSNNGEINMNGGYYIYKYQKYNKKLMKYKFI
jgi:hypothetical protein